MKLVNTKFKSGGLHEKHAVAVVGDVIFSLNTGKYLFSFFTVLYRKFYILFILDNWINCLLHVKYMLGFF